MTTNETVLKKFPFLRDFPFPDFKIEEIEGNKFATMFYFNSDRNIEKSLVSSEIAVFDSELEWVSTIADSIKELDTIHLAINRGLDSASLIEKRDAMRECIAWLIKLNDGKRALSFDMFSDVMLEFINHYQVKDTVKFVNTLNKLSRNNALVTLSTEEYMVLLSFYDFHFVYTKLMLGIIIASKIAV